MKMTVMLALVAVMALPVGAVEVGEKAPEFKLMDQNGTAVKLSDSAGSIRVLEWTNPECPFVVRHYKAETMKKLAAKYGDKNVVWLTINSSHHQDRDTNLAMIKTYKLNQTLLTDQDGAVGRAYEAKTTPHMYIVDGDGKVVYAGAIDDDPRGRKESPLNYVDQALEALVAGKAVPTASTDPYGCSVKYAK
jgi:peroxiredoxin